MYLCVMLQFVFEATCRTESKTKSAKFKKHGVLAKITNISPLSCLFRKFEGTNDGSLDTGIVLLTLMA